MSQIADRVDGVTLHVRKVRVLAYDDASGVSVGAHESRGNDGGGGQGGSRREAGLDVKVELTHQLQSRSVGPGHDGNAGLAQAADEFLELVKVRSKIGAGRVTFRLESALPEATFDRGCKRAGVGRTRDQAIMQSAFEIAGLVAPSSGWKFIA